MQRIFSKSENHVETAKKIQPNHIAVVKLDKKIQLLKVKRAELLAKFTELHPDVVMATQQIKRLEQEKSKLAQEKE